MRNIIILAMFVTLLFLPGVSPAETVQECQKNCSADVSDRAANCPPPGKDTDVERSQCLMDIQTSLKDCLEACMKASSLEAPKDVPADQQKDTKEEGQADAPPIAPPDEPK